MVVDAPAWSFGPGVPREQTHDKNPVFPFDTVRASAILPSLFRQDRGKDPGQFEASCFRLTQDLFPFFRRVEPGGANRPGKDKPA